MNARNGVFISYSHNDTEWLDHLRVHLKFLEKNHAFEIWDDTKIRPGANWREEISKAIGSAQIALLLISPDFLASEFITEEELPPLLDAAQHEGAHIFPIVVSHCMFSDFDSLSKFQAVNPVSKPLVEITKGQRDKLFVKVTKEIKLAFSKGNSANEKNKKKNKKIKLSEFKSQYKLALARMSTMYILSKKDTGLSISEIFKISKTKNRKYIHQAISEMEYAAMIIREKKGKNIYWKLSEKGEKFAEQIGDSIIME